MTQVQAKQYAELVAQMAALLVEAHGEVVLTDADRLEMVKDDIAVACNDLLPNPVF